MNTKFEVEQEIKHYPISSLSSAVTLIICVCSLLFSASNSLVFKKPFEELVNRVTVQAATIDSLKRTNYLMDRRLILIETDIKDILKSQVDYRMSNDKDHAKIENLLSVILKRPYDYR